MLWIRQCYEVARQTSIRLLGNRMLFLIGALGLLASLGLLLLPDRAFQHEHGYEIYGLMTYWSVFQVALPFSVLFFGVTALHSGLEDRTMTFLFVRPLHRSCILLGSWLGAVFVCWCLTAIILCLGYVCFAFPDRPWRHGSMPEPAMLGWFLLGAVFACAAYSALAVLAAALLKRPLVWGILFVIGWEGFASNLPRVARVSSLTAAEPIRRWIAIHLGPVSSPDLKELLLARSDQEMDMDFEALGDPLIAIGRFTAVALGIALFVFGRREYDARPRD